MERWSIDDQKRKIPDEARTMLADIYNWFIEGFDTVDLKDAKALLESLDPQSAVTPQSA